MIPVTKTYLPSRKKYDYYLRQIWKTGWLTNGGQFVKELEKRLAVFLGMKHVICVNNGTTALQIAIHALGESGEIVTTPFTYVATTASIVWERFKPVFADIDPKTLTIDPIEVEKVITPRTRAILPVHVYGIPCNVGALAKIADKHHLPIIYDAAHAFGVQYKGKPIAAYGEVSIFSFHATKLFHTIEGGALATNDDDLAKKYRYYRNFGHETPESFADVGINGKMNEFQAAMGLSILDDVPKLIEKRKRVFNLYHAALEGVPNLAFPKIPAHTEYNYAYFPVILKSEKDLILLVKEMNKYAIFPRRYFFPSLNQLKYITQGKASISQDYSNRILCLPFYAYLSKVEIGRIANLIKRVIIN